MSVSVVECRGSENEVEIFACYEGGVESEHDDDEQPVRPKTVCLLP